MFCRILQIEMEYSCLVKTAEHGCVMIANPFVSWRHCRNEAEVICNNQLRDYHESVLNSCECGVR